MRNHLRLRQMWISPAWLVLALVSQYSAQRLVVAGPFVRHQHYPGPAELLTSPRIAYVSILVLQAILVIAGLSRMWPRLRDWARVSLPEFRILPLAILFVMSAAAVSRSPKHFAFELGLGSLLQLSALGNIAVALAALPKPALEWISGHATRLAESAKGAADEPEGIDRFSIFAALFVVVVASLLAVFSYERHPHVPDEIPYLFHARYFAAGKLFLPAPPVAAAFDLDLVHIAGNRWFSPVPPGWPAVLALGARAGIPWMVNPLLAGLNIILAGLLLRQLYPVRTARIAVLLLSTSPWFLFMGMNFMTHMSSLAASLAAAVACGRYLKTGKLSWILLAGAFTGALSLIRPLEGLIVAVLLSAWIMFDGTRAMTARLQALVLLGVASMIVGALVLPYNYAIAGNAFRFPLNAYLDANYPPGANDMGFGINRGLGWPGLDPFPGHGIPDVIVNAMLNLHSINIELSGWATGSMIVLAAVIFSGKLSASDWKMLAAIFAVAGLHSFYWFSGGPDFGARYWFLAIVPLVALVARTPDILGSGNRPQAIDAPATAGRQRYLTAGLLVLSLMALATYVPWRAEDKYRGYRGMIPDIRAVARDPDFRNTLVLVRGKRHPDYASAAAYNPLDLNSDAPIFAWGRTDDVEQSVRAQFPQRRVVVMDGPSITGSGYRIAGPPMSPAADTTR